MESRLEFEKSVPEVGDIVVGVPHRQHGEIMSMEVSQQIHFKLYSLECKMQDGEVRTMLVPDFHFHWLGDHWILSSKPYEITVESPLSLDWFVTDPESQTTQSFVAPTAAAAVAMSMNQNKSSSDSVCVGKLNSISVKIDGGKILRQLLVDLDKRHHPVSPFHGLDCTEGGRAQLTAQMMFFHPEKISRFSRAVEKAFNDLTAGHGFWWMMEGRTDLHCVECYRQIASCVCPNDSNGNDASHLI
tara:strand:+ start:1798 stop:2529 length:732 start_codon:yes stop_codon:yes gene_type:complete